MEKADLVNLTIMELVWELRYQIKRNSSSSEIKKVERVLLDKARGAIP